VFAFLVLPSVAWLSFWVDLLFGRDLGVGWVGMGYDGLMVFMSMCSWIWCNEWIAMWSFCCFVPVCSIEKEDVLCFLFFCIKISALSKPSQVTCLMHLLIPSW